MNRCVKRWIALLLVGGMMYAMTGCLNPNRVAEELGELMQENTIGNREQNGEGGTRHSDQSNAFMLPDQNLPNASEQSTVAEKRVLIIEVDGIIYQGNQKVIVLSFDNQTGSDVRFYGASERCVLRIATEQGVFDTEIGGLSPLPTGRSVRTIVTEYAPGEVQKVVLTRMTALFDTIANVEIYSVENEISKVVCDFASGSYSGESTADITIKGSEAHAEPQSGELLIEVDGIIDQGDTKTIALYYNNKTGQRVLWAWAKAAYLIVTTDEGEYSQKLEYDPLAMGIGYVNFTMNNCPGEVMKVTLTSICVLTADGFPKEELTKVCIYDHSANITSTICVPN